MKFSVFVLFLIGCASATVIPRGLENVHLSTDEIIVKYGYPAETYQVQTDDGYILTLHRIPFGVKCGAEKSKGSVFLKHGLLGSSSDWVVTGPDHGLGFIFADNCYDVWMGNSRGNRYSKAHSILDPVLHSETFWDFNWHHMGVYDLPAAIDCALQKSGKDQLIYIGHSQGNTEFFVFSELHPEYQSKIKGFLAMAPLAFVQNSKSYFFQIARSNPEWLAENIGEYEFSPSQQLINLLAELQGCIDVSPALQPVCDNILFLIAGFDDEQLNTTALPEILDYVPAGTTTKTFLHHVQSVISGKFRYYDLGAVKNVLVYGSTDPPEYQLDKVTVPTYLYYADNDLLVDAQDFEVLRNKLGNVVATTKVQFEKFSHLDYLWAIDVVELLYKPMLEVMDSL